MENSTSIDSVFMTRAGVMQHRSIASPKKLIPPSYKIVLFSIDVLTVTGCFLLLNFWVEPASWSNLALKSMFFLFPVFLVLLFFRDHRLYSHHFIFLKSNHLVQFVRAFFWVFATFFIISATYLLPERFSSQIVVTGVIFFSVGVLLLSRLIGTEIVNLLKSLGIAFLTVGLLGIVFPEMHPFEIVRWQTIAIGLLLSVPTLLALRFFTVQVVFNDWLRRRFRRQALVIGTGDEATRITSHVIQRNAPYWINGVIGEKEIHASVTKRRLGTFEELPAIVEENQIDEIIVTDEQINKWSLISLLDFCISEGITVWFPPKLMMVINTKIVTDNFCGLQMIRFCSQKHTWLSLKLKHTIDALVTLPGFFLILPLFTVLSLAVKLTSKGPVFYRAEAIGKGGHPFTMYKFRSMRIDSDSAIHREYVSRFIKGEIKNGGDKPLKIADDPRVTSVGKWLRKLSLDELPQLINVLKGDMSLVGPRPCLPYEYEIYKDWHKKRTAVRPGITGLWQVVGRSEVEFEDMILLDLYYIYNRSLMIDLNILYETLYVILSKKGAY